MAKPAFDPTKPFETVGEKPAFDPSKPFEALSPLEVNPVAGAVTSAARGATLGLWDKGNAAIDATVEGALGFPGTWSERYESGLGHNRAVADANKAANPGLMMGAEIAGAVASPIPGGTAAKGAGYATRVGRSVLQGVGMGGVYGYGTSRAKDAQGVVADTALGGLVGGAAGAVGEGIVAPVLSQVGKVVSPAMDYMRKKVSGALGSFAERKAVKATGGALQKELRQLGPRVQQVGRDLLDERVVTAGASVADIAARSSALKGAQGKAIGEILDAADAGKARFNWRPVLDRVRAELGGLNPTELRAAGDATRALDDIMTAANSGGGFRVANDLKAALNDTINRADPKLKTALTKRVVRALTEEIDGQIGTALSPEARTGLETAKRLYGSASEAKKLATKGLGRQEANRSVSLTDYLAGIGGGVASVASGRIEPLIMAGGAAIANKVARERGNQVLAAGADRLSKSLALRTMAKSNPERLAQVIGGDFARALTSAASHSDERFAATHYMLSQSSPKYREGITQLDEDSISQTH